MNWGGRSIQTDLAKQALHDVEAFAELYRCNLTRVYRYHMAHVGNTKDAEDLTSQTFVAALITGVITISYRHLRMAVIF